MESGFVVVERNKTTQLGDVEIDVEI